MARLSYSFLIFVIAFQNLCIVVNAAPSPDETTVGRAKCNTLQIRKEWRDISVEDRKDYVRAVKCLMNTPSSSPREGVKSRFDEFQGSHIDLTDEVHQVGHFLAWHRHYLTLYDKALREECGYRGPGTYWDWTRDADGPGLMRDSPIFDPETGFGGNGVPGTYTPPPAAPGNPGFPGFPGLPPGGGFGNQGCVGTGPFKNVTINLGPGRNIGAHCLVRGINEPMKQSVTSANVRTIMVETTFERFRTLLENGGRGIAGLGIHGGGHGVVGGELMDPASSPGEPLFYLHHGNLDRIWWKWQSVDPKNRLYALSGPTTQRPPFTNITLDFLMPFTSLSPRVAVRDVMDTESEPSCFQYND
ncbi:Di-copper centre-containing protein [Coprinopsis marcescibilis]|uniref:Di-copper centre-containing protein n=1 Tax=Coprinopsis marcescibilis TaxID=230819 RepID=A0A5C3KD81_COPMA|nr:Di-copper centre-containing protein [Coprinopsis marcescibilis]